MNSTEAMRRDLECRRRELALCRQQAEFDKRCQMKEIFDREAREQFDAKQQQFARQCQQFDLEKQQILIKIEQFIFEKEQFNFEKEQVALEIEQFTFEKQQLALEKEQLARDQELLTANQQRFNQQFSLEKVASQNEHQRRLDEISKEVSELDLKKKLFQQYLQMQLMPHSVDLGGSLLDLLLDISVSESVADDYMMQEEDLVENFDSGRNPESDSDDDDNKTKAKTPVETVEVEPKSKNKKKSKKAPESDFDDEEFPIKPIATLEDMVGIPPPPGLEEKYNKIIQKLRDLIGIVRKKHRQVTRRDELSQQWYDHYHAIQAWLGPYIRFLAKRHQKIVRSLNKYDLLQTNYDNLEEKAQNLEENLSEVESALEELGIEDKVFEDPDSSFAKKQIILHSFRWKMIDREATFTYARKLRTYNESYAKLERDGRDTSALEVPIEQTTLVSIFFNFPQINKKVHVNCRRDCSDDTLLSRLYRYRGEDNSVVTPICEVLLKRDYKIALIPKYSKELKLFVSSPQIDSGRWIQFHGPGKEIGGHSPLEPLNLFAMLDPARPGDFSFKDDRDRCVLSKEKCVQKHKNNKGSLFHSSPQEVFNAEYEISIKWDKL